MSKYVSRNVAFCRNAQKRIDSSKTTHCVGSFEDCRSDFLREIQKIRWDVRMLDRFVVYRSDFDLFTEPEDWQKSILKTECPVNPGESPTESLFSSIGSVISDELASEHPSFRKVIAFADGAETTEIPVSLLHKMAANARRNRKLGPKGTAVFRDSVSKDAARHLAKSCYGASKIEIFFARIRF